MVLGLVLGLGGIFGLQQYRGRGEAQTQKASALYQELLDVARAGRSVRVDEIAAVLAKDYGRTPYADQARLMQAKLAMDNSAPDEAAKYLRRVAEDADSPELRAIARLRWARVLLQAEKYDEALKVVSDVPKDSAFGARFHELRGDIRVAQGKIDEARAEYDEALKSTEPGVIDHALVQAKHDDLGVGSPPADAAKSK